MMCAAACRRRTGCWTSATPSSTASPRASSRPPGSAQSRRSRGNHTLWQSTAREDRCPAAPARRNGRSRSSMGRAVASRLTLW
uniref:Uncharacterized protein n=1 Tax=Arundo donax TaxID=35708 RepID=A0A0A9ALD1_ARUDO